MPNSKRSLRYGAVAVLLVLTGSAALRRYLKRLTTALLMCCVISTPALAARSGLFGPQAPAPRATAVQIPTDEARAIAATLSECETVAVELATEREEAVLLRRALDLTTKAAAAYEAASAANAERAANEKQRAENEKFLRATAEANLKREKRAGKWRAIRWATVALGAGVVVGAVMGGR